MSSFCWKKKDRTKCGGVGSGAGSGVSVTTPSDGRDGEASDGDPSSDVRSGFARSKAVRNVRGAAIEPMFPGTIATASPTNASDPATSATQGVQRHWRNRVAAIAEDIAGWLVWRDERARDGVV
jgi:hypothetical protein